MCQAKSRCLSRTCRSREPGFPERSRTCEMRPDNFEVAGPLPPGIEGFPGSVAVSMFLRTLGSPTSPIPPPRTSRLFPGVPTTPWPRTLPFATSRDAAWRHVWSLLLLPVCHRSHFAFPWCEAEWAGGVPGCFGGLTMGPRWGYGAPSQDGPPSPGIVPGSICPRRQHSSYSRLTLGDQMQNVLRYLQSSRYMLR